MWQARYKQLTVLSWSKCLLRLFFSFFFYSLCYKSDIWKTDLLMWKNWTWRTAICSQVAKHTRPSEAVGNGPWMTLHLRTDKAETQPGDLLKTRQTESTALIISTEVTSWREGQCFICCWSWKACWLQSCHNFISSFTFFPCQITHGFDAEQACSARTGGFYQCMSCSQAAHTVLFFNPLREGGSVSHSEVDLEKQKNEGAFLSKSHIQKGNYSCAADS